MKHCRHPDGCPGDVQAKGLCNMHYQRLRMRGDIGQAGELRTWKPKGCSEDGCPRPHQAKGLCGMHYQCQWRTGDTTGQRGRYQLDHRPDCGLADCPRDYWASDRCRIHQPRDRWVPEAARIARWAMWGDRCYMCGDQATCSDHVIPRALGGLNLPANIRPACAPCNGRKSDRWEGIAWLASLVAA